MDTNDSDKIFREKLGKFAAEPDPHVWDRIQHSLDKKRRKRLVPLWLPMGAAVAVVLLALWFTGPYSESTPGEYPVTETETKPANRPPGDSPSRDAGSGTDLAPKDNSGLTGTETSGEQSPTNAATSTGESVTRKPGATAVTANNAVQGRNSVGVTQSSADSRQRQTGSDPAQLADPAATVAQGAGGQAENTGDRALKATAGEVSAQNGGNAPVAAATAIAGAETEAGADNAGKKSIFDVLDEQETLEKVAAEKGRWSVGPSIAPVYYNSFGNGSPIASAFMENSKSGTVNLSYGLSVAYEVSDRLSLRSGIHKVDFGYNTNQVSFTSTVAVRPSSLIRTISYSENSKNVVVHSTLSPTSPAQQEGAALDVTAASPLREGSMLQQFGYLEVPFELQYALINRQWGLNLIGGMSSLFLIDNSVSLDSAGTSTEIGQASNINALNFSTNLGLGFYYQLNPKWQLQLQPMVKMHLNTFNETAGSFRPYTVGVYSGMSFRF